jgi:hypothetical protein
MEVYERLLPALLEHEEIVPTPGLERPVLVRRRSRDVWVYRQVFLDRECELAMPTPRLIIDAGANVGYTTLYFAARFPQARIVAIEPEAENCRQWSRNCGHLERAELVEAALWPRSGSVRIANPDGTGAPRPPRIAAAEIT